MKSRFSLWANQKPSSRDPSNRGRSLRQNSQSSAGRLRAFILDFPVVFHSQKERGKVRKTLPFIKTCPGMKDLTCFSFSARTNSKNFTLFTSFYVSTPLLMISSDHNKTGKSGTTSARALYLKSDVKWICILVVLNLHRTKTTGFKGLHKALCIRPKPTEWRNATLLLIETTLPN